MAFYSSNKIVGYCAEGMEAEARGDIANAKSLFEKAWTEAATDFEKFTAAHYMARNQEDAHEELKWNLASIHFAHMVNDDDVKPYFASLHLNTGKSYETLKDFDSAKQHYGLAASYMSYLSNDGYGKMIRKGIEAALKKL